MTEANAIRPLSDHKDRTIGLVVFGIAQCLFGVLWVLMVLLVVFSLSIMASEASGAEAAMSAKSLIVVIVMYSVAAIWFFTMGVGSILARRWARALTLVSSWLWLVMGAAGLGAAALFVPGVYDEMAATGQIPAEMVVSMKIFLGVFWLIFGVLLPATLILFYGSKHVKATCDAKDPRARWTDACPLPVLALSLLSAWFGVSMLSMSVYGWVFPFFGSILKGWAGAVFILVLMAAFLYVAWGSYRLDMKAWWVAILIFLLLSVSTAFTFYRIDLMDYYRMMDMPPEQLKQIESMNIPNMRTMGMYYALWPIMWFGYLLYVRKYFVQALSPPK